MGPDKVVIVSNFTTVLDDIQALAVHYNWQFYRLVSMIYVYYMCYECYMYHYDFPISGVCHTPHNMIRVLILSSISHTYIHVCMLLIVCVYMTLCYIQDGSTAVKKRQGLVDAFNRKGDPKTLFLLSSKAGGMCVYYNTYTCILLI